MKIKIEFRTIILLLTIVIVIFLILNATVLRDVSIIPSGTSTSSTTSTTTATGSTTLSSNNYNIIDDTDGGKKLEITDGSLTDEQIAQLKLELGLPSNTEVVVPAAGYERPVTTSPSDFESIFSEEPYIIYPGGPDNYGSSTSN